MWMHDPTGIYFVKSGYNTLKIWQTQQTNYPSTSSVETLIWKKIWSLHTIPRHKVLLWRILNNSLPVRSALSKRGIQCYPLCPRCHSKIETITHLFMTCPISKRVWFGSNLSINFDNFPNPNFTNWLCEAILHKDECIIIQIAAIICNLWHARNLSIFEDQMILEMDIIQ